MRFLTNFGDAAVLAPLAAAVLFWLFGIAGRRLAIVWGEALLLAAGSTALLKILLFACGSPGAALESPSGHASMSTLVYGGLALIVGSESAAWPRLAAGAAGAAAVVAIALTRLLVGGHSLSEVAVGLAIGGAALLFFARSYLAERHDGRQIWPLLAAAAILALALHGHISALEPVWHRVALYLGDATGFCRA
jgi:membrane-associated phospholipid phosphatase